MKYKLLNGLLFVSFVLTVMVPITGVPLHKAASLAFLLLSLIHTWLYRKKLQAKRYLLLFIIIVAFVSGVFGMIGEHAGTILQYHKAISIGSVFFLAIHTFIFHKRMIGNAREGRVIYDGQ